MAALIVRSISLSLASSARRRDVLSVKLCSYCMIHDNDSKNPTHEIGITKSIIQMLTVIFAGSQKRPLSLCLYVHLLCVWVIPKIRASFIILCYWYLFSLNLSPKQLCLYLIAINEGWFYASICNLLTYFQFGHWRRFVGLRINCCMIAIEIKKETVNVIGSFVMYLI